MAPLEWIVREAVQKCPPQLVLMSNFGARNYKSDGEVDFGATRSYVQDTSIIRALQVE
jgi:hypothetical protein